MLDEQRQPSGVIEMRVSQQDRIDFVRTNTGRKLVLGFALLATLEHAGVDQDDRATSANDIGRAGDFATGGADEFDFHGR